jgi:beta-lactam-binding protein with PASTA domain
VHEEGSDKPKGTILSQFPAADTVMNKGDTVSLIVSSGHAPDTTTTAVDAGATTPST